MNDWLPIAELTPWARNPRRNDGIPTDRVAESLKRFGFVAPIVVWKSAGRMVAGHTRLKALSKLLAADPTFTPKGAPGPGLARVLFHEFADENEADAYALADNKLGELAEWDETALAEILGRLGAEERFAAGFDECPKEAATPPPDEAPAPPKTPVTKLGDLWTLGDHRLVCGDSREAAVVGRVAKDAALLWTDPPYNVALGHETPEEAKARNRRTDGKVVQNDSMGDGDFRKFLIDAFKAADGSLRAGGGFYIAHDDSGGLNFRGAVIDVGWKLAQCLIWVKDRFVMGRQDYHWRHEAILYGWKLGAGHHMLEDRTQDTVWECPRPGASSEHPTMKPIALIERAVRNSTNEGELVLDTFGGSGSTLMACTASNRKAALVELDPGYCDVIVERWQNHTGGKASRS